MEQHQPVPDDEAAVPPPSTQVRSSRKRRAAPVTAAPAAAAAAPLASVAAFSFDVDAELAASEASAKHARTCAAQASVSSTAGEAAPPAPCPVVSVWEQFELDSLVQPARTTNHAQRKAAARPAAPLATTEAAEEADAAPEPLLESAGAGRSSDPTPRCYLIHSNQHAELLDRQQVHGGRMLFFTSLLRSLRAARWPHLSIVPPRRAQSHELEMFHTPEYIAFIRHLCAKYERHDGGAVELMRPLSARDKELQEQYGLTDECAPFPELPDLIDFTVGATLRAVECLMEAHAAYPRAGITAVHWGGGRHHADADRAHGYCYCGDAVCACLRLQASAAYPRVLYLDLDLHHGDGVEKAFSGSRSVLTCSLHHHAPGFYPGTGSMEARGDTTAEHSLLNIPLKEGIDDHTYTMILDGVLSVVLPSFRPSVVVVCAGVDGLATDRMSTWNLTTRTYARAVHMLQKRLGHCQPHSTDGGPPAPVPTGAVPSPSVCVPPAWPASPVPLLLLGGGGYNPIDAARAFVQMTAAASQQALPTHVPDHERFLPSYLPDLELHSGTGKRTNNNDRAYLLDIMAHVRAACRAREAQDLLADADLL